MGDKENTYRLFVGKAEQNGTFGKTRRRLEDNTKTDLIETKQDSMDCIHMLFRAETSSGNFETR
jgi:hypothetical protein